MNGDIPSVPITTLAGISSLTDRKYIANATNAIFSNRLSIYLSNINIEIAT